jgi:beta-xylosidase
MMSGSLYPAHKTTGGPFCGLQLTAVIYIEHVVFLLPKTVWSRAVVEALVLWNEPNNLSHWNFHLDPDWRRFSEMVQLASSAIRRINPRVPIILGGVSACDNNFLRLMRSYGVMDCVDVVGVHGFPLDWNHWSIDEWPDRVAEAEDVAGKPAWVLEVGASSFGAEEVQVFGLERTLELLVPRTQRLHWYSLYDLPPGWPAETRHREAEGSSYYRHYHLGLLKSDGTPKMAATLFPRDGSAGLCQWFHFEDPRLEDAVCWMQRNRVRYLRTGLSWADSWRENATAWFDRMMSALAPFQVSLTLCFTPAHLGLEAHHTSPPKENAQFAEFAAWAAARYAPPAISAVPASRREEVEWASRS